MASLIVAFFVAALLYASVGFGGGSTYTALLALAEIDYRLLPLLSLACNIVVVAGSSLRFARAKVTPWRNALLLTGVAAPAALLGGLTPIDEATFLTILGASLVLTALTLLLRPRDTATGAPPRFAGAMPVLAVPLGYLAGLVGIGGGIFLAPFLHLTRWDSARAIAATASLFILVNSLFGLAAIAQGRYGPPRCRDRFRPAAAGRGRDRRADRQPVGAQIPAATLDPLRHSSAHRLGGRALAAECMRKVAPRVGFEPTTK